jgi:hypothetical protein
VSTPRQQLAAQLRTDNAGWDVYEWPAKLTELRKPTAVVYRTALAPVTGGLSHDLDLEVYGLRSDSGPETEDALDNLLDAAMLSLQRLPGVAVVKATRTTFADVFQGWALELRWTSSDIYKAQV